MTLADQKTETILELLAREKNVLLAGAPATGKTTLLTAVAKRFEDGTGTTVSLSGDNPFPNAANGAGLSFPAADCEHRKVFRTTFHQGTKYRDFVRGLAPKPNADGVCFEVTRGILWQAAEYAKESGHASLLIIDEINRGPAVSVFGDLISAFEADKRLGPDNRVTDSTVTVQILNDDADLVDYQLPDRLFILAAMNQADSSVEPMDTAFLRRWHKVKLLPSLDELYEYFDIDKVPRELPDKPESSADAYSAAVAALARINEKISLGRGEDYQIGHGALMKVKKSELPKQLDGTQKYLASCWPVIAAHVEEVFFGDIDAIAEVLNASNGGFFRVDSHTFAGREVKAIDYIDVTAENVYEMLRDVAK